MLSPVQSRGSMAWMSNQSLMELQSRMEKRDLRRRCAMDSGALLHKGHGPQFGQPLFARRSAIQRQFCRASQAKNLIFRGPNLPNKLVHVGGDGSKKLSFVGGGRGVLPTLRELLNDIVLHVFTKSNMMEEEPKVQELACSKVKVSSMGILPIQALSLRA